MLLVARRLKYKPGFWRLELKEIAEDKDGKASKGNVFHGDFSKSQVQVVEEISADHRYLINDDTFQVPEEQSFVSPLFFRH